MSKLEVLRSIWGFCHEKKNCRWAVFVPIVVNHKWNHLISDHPFLSDSFLFRKIYHAMLQLGVTESTRKARQKTGHHFFDIDFYFLILFWRAPWLINPKMTEFPLSHMPRHTVAHAKIPRRCQEFPMFSLLGWNVFFAIFWNDKKRGFCCTSRFTSYWKRFHRAWRGDRTKVLRRPDLGVQKTNVTGFMRN